MMFVSYRAVCVRIFLLLLSPGFVVQGSNGEYAFLDVDERIEMVKRVSEMAARDKLIIAGSGCECEHS